MSVTITIPSNFYQFTLGMKTVQVEGGTVGECLNDLMRCFPDLDKKLIDSEGKLHGYVDILVNKESSFPEELDKSIQAGDEIEIFFIVGGG